MCIRDDGHAVYLDDPIKAEAYDWETKARKLEDQGQLDEATAAMEKAVALSPEDYYFWDSLDEMYTEKKAWPKAEDAYRQTVRLRPDRFSCHGNLGDALYRQEEIR